jgi:hypothetical protein
MRTFIVTCLIAVAIAVGTAVILDSFVQESSERAFAERSVRI